ncbi:MAG: phosphotransferase, partial [Candidatus Eisenbacteria bacterium]|nr:phosphotransferase [Candidatus Latescibacterota bacterium]MBD3302329.1 phosphotransferase [Candidatus Eisenbacteria bacterium]
MRDLRLALQIDAPLEISVVKQRLGQRAVLRVRSVEEDPPAVWFVKLQRRRVQPDRIAQLRSIAEIGERAEVRIPRPVALLPRYRATILTPVSGDRILSGAEPPRVLQEVGEAIARLHRLLPALGPLRREGFEGSRVDRSGSLIDALRPDLRDRFDAAAARWWANRPRGPRSNDAVLSLHGDFYPAQVLVAEETATGRGRVGLLDWDEVCRGDPERDIGNFDAHLILEEVRTKSVDQRTAPVDAASLEPLAAEGAEG